jgi:hypothetical protein
MLLDCSFNEDKCKIWKSNAPEILSLLRKLSLNFIVPVIKQFGSSNESVTSMPNLLSGNWEYLMEILTHLGQSVLLTNCFLRKKSNDKRRCENLNHAPV